MKHFRIFNRFLPNKRYVKIKITLILSTPKIAKIKISFLTNRNMVRTLDTLRKLYGIIILLKNAIAVIAKLIR